MRKHALLTLAILLTAPLTTSAPSITVESPSDTASVENPVSFQFTPDCTTGCDEATLYFNGTGNLTFHWTQDSTQEWLNGQTQDLDIEDGELSLHRNQLGNLNYSWFDTSEYYNSNGHPNTLQDFNQFFNTSNAGVELNGTGNHNGSVSWHSNRYGAVPGYLPGERYSWRASGHLYAPVSGTYSIGIDSDDSADIFIDGEQVVSWYGGHGASGDYSNSGQINLNRGDHTIRIRMEEGTGGDGVSVAWQKPGDSSFSVIPGERLSNSSFGYETNGSYLSQVLELEKPGYFTSADIDQNTPAGTQVETIYEAKVGDDWNSYTSIADVPRTKYLRVNSTLTTTDTNVTPTLDSLDVEYALPSNIDFSHVTGTASEWDDGSFSNTEIDGDSLTLSRDNPGNSGRLRYEWYNTSSLNQQNDYANNRTEMDWFTNTSTQGVALGGKGLHERRVHWQSGGWDEKPSYLPSSNYAWKAHGYIYIPSDGTYTFGIDSDDGSDLIIDGNLVTSYYGPHGTAGSYGNSGDITLDEGYHSVQIRMQERTGGDGVSVAWQKPGDSSFSTVPENQFSPRSYQPSGEYVSRTFSRERAVDWENSEVTASTDFETDYSIEYGQNNSGSWVYNDSISDLPDTKYLRYRISMSTSNDLKTPEIQEVNISYANSAESFTARKTLTDIQENTVNNISFDFSSYDLPETLTWNIELAGDGSTATSSNHTLTVTPTQYPQPELEWLSPSDDAENRTPIDFDYTPTCYSQFGCQDVSLYFNTTGDTLNWTTESQADWSTGTNQNTTVENGQLKLEATPGTQGSLNYQWFSTQGYNSIDSFANTESEMDEFFNTDRTGVTLNGSGTYSGQIRWHSNNWGPKPAYLTPGNYAWKVFGYVYAPSDGTYTFAVDSDDGSDLFIDGEQIASYYGGHSVSGGYSNSGQVTLTEGYHAITARMQENTGGDGISIGWQKPGDTSISEIPSNRLYTVERKNPGTYTSDFIHSQNKVNWTSAEVDTKIPSGTSTSVRYQENSSGSWQSYSDIANMPESRYMRYQVDMDTSSQETPSVEMINITYFDSEVYRQRKQATALNQTSDTIKYDFRSLDLPQVFRVALELKQSDGQTRMTSERTITINPTGRETTISWSDDSETETGFRIYTNSSGTWNQVGEVGRNSEQFTHLNANVNTEKYVCYRVEAFNTAGASSPAEGCATLSK